MKKLEFMLFSAALVLAMACTDVDDDPGQTGDAGTLLDTFKFTDAGDVCSDPTGDYDGDGISNALEGCLSGRDSDGDKVPDWQDFDSDDDKLPDADEHGAKSSTGKCAGAKPGKDEWPCDTDNDGVPDYLDKDSDGDGLYDGNEDANYDGLLGCCLKTCNAPDIKWQKSNCKLTTDGCGSGQKCANKLCTPSAAFKCSEGETSPGKKDTFGDGKLDNERGTFICRDATEDKPQGRKPVQLRKDVAGDWHIAIEKFAKYGAIKVAGATTANMLAAASINYDKSTDEVAGFILSKSTTNTTIQAEMTALTGLLNSSGIGTVSVRASGTQNKSHDKFDQVEGTILDLTLTSTSDVSSARNQVVAALLGKTSADLSNVSAPFGSSHSDLVLRFTTVRRFAFKKDSAGNLVLDAKGDPTDDLDKTKWRIIVMGAVVSKTNYQNPKLQTGFLVDDLSNGTPVAIAKDTVSNECDVGTIIQLPVADIIWVVDESGSMDDNRQDIVNNANNFFSRALSSGLDFRMGVTNVISPTGTYKQYTGQFCSKVSSNTSDCGNTDRFLLPSEQNIFSACIKNPPCYEGASEYGLVNAYDAVKKHLPRAANDQSKIRKTATLVIIVATDEIPQGLSGAIGGYSNYSQCTLPAANQTKVDAAIQKYLDMFTGITDPEGAAMFHVIGGVCNNTCNADVAHGYKELAQKLGGQTASVCQKNLGNTLQVIIDTITGKASPVVLDYVPISSSLAVAMDAVEINRSRTNGFDYRTNGNSLVFINVKYKKGSEVIASYKRWKRQDDIK